MADSKLTRGGARPASQKEGNGAPPPRILFAAGLLAATTLALQIALSRHLSFLLWSHCSFWVLGVGMLGFGAAGALLSRGEGVPDTVVGRRSGTRGSILATASLGFYLIVGPLVEIEPLALFDDPWQHARMLALVMLIFVPFLGLGLAQGALLAGYRHRVFKVYSADLVGAGLGCLLVIQLLTRFAAEEVLALCAGAAAVAAALIVERGRTALRSVVWTAVVASAVAVVSGWAERRPFKPAPSKGIASFLSTEEGAPSIELSVSAALMRLDVSEPLPTPFLFNGTVDFPQGAEYIPTRIIFEDGAAPTFLHRIEDPAALPFLGRTNQSLAYQIRRRPRVCAIGVGGGTDVQIALHHGARSVIAVEMNPDMVRLVRTRYSDFIHGLFHRPEVSTVVSDGRRFLSTTRERFDVIQLNTVATQTALAAGAYSFAESYIHTVEGAASMFGALAPDGLFSFSEWYLEPSVSHRYAASLAEALRRGGIDRAGDHFFVIRADSCVTILVCRRPLSAAELDTLTSWTSSLGWEVLFSPQGAQHPALAPLLAGTETDRAELLAVHPHDLSVVTDDRPFFLHLTRWRSWLDRLRGLPAPELPAGDALLVMTLVESALLAGCFVIAPLWFAGGQVPKNVTTLRRLAIFAASGIAFMAHEVIALELFTVFLGSPLYSMAASLGALLVASGVGSLLARRWAAVPSRLIMVALAVLTAWGLATAVWLRPLLLQCFGWPLGLRAMLVMLWLLPAGLALGVPFPTAIDVLRRHSPAMVPWAWGVSACCSVLAATGSVFSAMSIGFRATLVVATFILWLGFLLWRGTAIEPG